MRYYGVLPPEGQRCGWCRKGQRVNGWLCAECAEAAHHCDDCGQFVLPGSGRLLRADDRLDEFPPLCHTCRQEL